MAYSILVRFMSLSGAFKTVREETFVNETEATKAVKAYAAANGFSGVKLVDSSESDDLRWTAHTLGGRSGRNIAFGYVAFGDVAFGDCP